MKRRIIIIISSVLLSVLSLYVIIAAFLYTDFVITYTKYMTEPKVEKTEEGVNIYETKHYAAIGSVSEYNVLNFKKDGYDYFIHSSSGTTPDRNIIRKLKVKSVKKSYNLYTITVDILGIYIHNDFFNSDGTLENTNVRFQYEPGALPGEIVDICMLRYESEFNFPIYKCVLSSTKAYSIRCEGSTYLDVSYKPNIGDEIYATCGTLPRYYPYDISDIDINEYTLVKFIRK
ncbi:MAG: hypothetical protein J6R47_06825 [Acholeplasmatales bacterium]|nr:hypothetical protein [Acholeplasmatales bacterium]